MKNWFVGSQALRSGRKTKNASLCAKLLDMSLLLGLLCSLMACGVSEVQPQTNLVVTVAPGAAQIDIDGVGAANAASQETALVQSRDALASSYVLAPGAYYTVKVKSPGHTAFSRKYFLRDGRKLDLKLGLARKGGKLPEGGYVEAFEAESLKLASATTQDDGDASSGGYLAPLATSQQSGKPSASQTFFAPEDGNYTLWARLAADSDKEANVKLGFNDAYKNLSSRTELYKWIEVDRVRLKAGQNQISVGGGADARIDLFVVSSKPLKGKDLVSFITTIEKEERKLPTPRKPGGGGSPDKNAPLTWSPPSLDTPTILEVKADGRQSIFNLDTGTDYIIKMPNKAVTRAVILKGGRHVVMIGGEIAIPWQGDNPSIASRTGLKIKGATGTVHIEGLLIHGDDLSEGIQIDAPNAVVQIQNVAVMGVHARDQVGFTDNHPDLIQSYGNAKEIRVDKFTGSSDYQGLFFKADYNGPHGPIDLRRVNIIGDATARYLLWFQPQEGAAKVTLEHVYVEAKASGRPLGRLVWPDQNGRYPNVAELEGSTSPRASWPEEMSPSITGYVDAGRPPGGDFVPAKSVGKRYRSPGYK